MSLSVLLFRVLYERGVDDGSRIPQTTLQPLRRHSVYITYTAVVMSLHARQEHYQHAVGGFPEIMCPYCILCNTAG